MSVQVFFQNGVDAPGHLSLGTFADADEATAACTAAVAQFGTAADAAAWHDGYAPEGFGTKRLIGEVFLTAPGEQVVEVPPVQLVVETTTDDEQTDETDEAEAEAEAAVEKPSKPRRRAPKKA